MDEACRETPVVLTPSEIRAAWVVLRFACDELRAADAPVAFTALSSTLRKLEEAWRGPEPETATGEMTLGRPVER